MVNELRKIKIMEKIQYLKLEPAENGYVLSWTECEMPIDKSTYSNCTYSDYKEVFASDKGEEALKRMRELYAQNSESDSDKD